MDNVSDEASKKAEKKAKNCCLGLLEINGNFVLSEVPDDKTALKYNGTIQVTTITKCIDIKCEGITWEGLNYLSCDNEVEEFNKNAGASIVGGDDGFTIYVEGMCKLGCCDHPCPNKFKTETHRVSGIVPNGREKKNDVLQQVVAGYAFGGTNTKPTFQSCCKGGGADGSSR